MKKQALLLAALSTFLSGCDENNTPPTITDIEEHYIVVAGGTLELSPFVSDADGDPVTVEWKQTTGEPLWEEQPTGTELTLNIPESERPGTKLSAVDIVASDGKEETIHKVLLTVRPMRTDGIIPLDCPRGDTACTDVEFNLRDINTYRIYESFSDKFEVEMVSESGAVFDFKQLQRLSLDSGRKISEVHEMFDFNEETNTLFVKKERVTEFNQLLSKGDELSDLHVSGKDTAGHDVSREILFYYGYGAVKGAVVDTEGNVLSGLAGELVTLRGSSRTTFVTYQTLINSDGTFEFNNLRSDDYHISMPRTRHVSAFGSITIASDSPSVNVNIQINDLTNTDKRTSVNDKEP